MCQILESSDIAYSAMYLSLSEHPTSSSISLFTIPPFFIPTSNSCKKCIPFLTNHIKSAIAVIKTYSFWIFKNRQQFLNITTI